MDHLSEPLKFACMSSHGKCHEKWHGSTLSLSVCSGKPNLMAPFLTLKHSFRWLYYMLWSTVMVNISDRYFIEISYNVNFYYVYISVGDCFGSLCLFLGAIYNVQQWLLLYCNTPPLDPLGGYSLYVGWYGCAAVLTPFLTFWGLNSIFLANFGVLFLIHQHQNYFLGY